MSNKHKEQGICPYCGSFNIDYYDHVHDGDVFDYICRCTDCKKKFRECYHLEYDGMYDEYGDKEIK